MRPSPRPVTATLSSCASRRCARALAVRSPPPLARCAQCVRGRAGAPPGPQGRLRLRLAPLPSTTTPYRRLAACRVRWQSITAPLPSPAPLPLWPPAGELCWRGDEQLCGRRARGGGGAAGQGQGQGQGGVSRQTSETASAGATVDAGAQYVGRGGCGGRRRLHTRTDRRPRRAVWPGLVVSGILGMRVCARRSYRGPTPPPRETSSVLPYPAGPLSPHACAGRSWDGCAARIPATIAGDGGGSGTRTSISRHKGAPY